MPKQIYTKDNKKTKTKYTPYKNKIIRKSYIYNTKHKTKYIYNTQNHSNTDIYIRITKNKINIYKHKTEIY